MIRNLSQRRSATALRRAAEGESTRTIVIALLANIVIAIAKLIAGLVSGSTGMLAEAAHSAADSVNEVFLAVGLHRDRQPPDVTHPLGHGRERFLWAFMAAIAIVSDWRLRVHRHGRCTSSNRPTRCLAVLRPGSFSRSRSRRTELPGCRACGRRAARRKNME